jgi:NAD(P)-dependent dehydrogenase (short-subunit alcohol dehydrogenase family)
MSLDFSLTDKVAIVTGAAPGGIGEAYAQALAAAGASVVVADIEGDAVKETASRLSADGRRTLASEVDITDPASVTAMVRTATDEFGGVDVLVNNAALMMQIPRVPLSEFPMDWWDRVMKVNVAGALNCVQAVVPSMRERGGGSIINQSSAGAFYNWGPYGVTKLALVGLTYGLARELGKDRIRVNAIAPGSMKTQAVLDSVGGEDSPWWQERAKLQSLPDTGLPEHLCGALLYLASPASSWFSGQCLNVDGGWINRL